MNLEKRILFFQTLKNANPEPKTELIYESTFELLVAVILSAQATDISVNKATKILFATANTPEKITRLGEAGLKQHIKTIGLYNSKAKNIIQTCKILVEKHDSIVPNERYQLEPLQGVGRKTAKVALITALRQIAMAVDTNIFRISNRTESSPGKPDLEVEKILLKLNADFFIVFINGSL